MKKDYAAWHAYKAQLQQLDIKLLSHFNEREIWWCSLGLNIGDEEDGKNALFERPVLILHKFNDHLFVCLPLTTNIKNNKFYFRVKSGNKDAAVMLSHIHTLDARRLRRRVGMISKEDYGKINKRIKDLLNLD